MSFATLKGDVPNWVYFLAGAMLPTIALVLIKSTGSGRNKERNRGSEKDGENLNRKNNNNSDSDHQADSDDDDDEDDESEHFAPGNGASSEWNYSHAPYKMVLCVNQELSMGKGKIAAQCSHAAVGCYKRASKQCPVALKAWERTGCAKIALKCPTEADMEEIAVRALSRDIPCYLVEDAGRTQIAAGSRTVLGLGPAPVSVFEGVSDHLKLM